MAITVTDLFIYPVKSLGRIELKNSDIQQRGLKWDRRWMVVDSSGMFMTQRDFPQMAAIKVAIDTSAAGMDSGGLVLTAADGKSVALSGAVETGGECVPVTVWKDTIDARPVSPIADEWLSRQLQTNCRLVYMPETTKRRIDPHYALESDITSFSDGFPILLASQQSLADLNGRIKLDPVPMARFRPNIVIDGTLPFEEDGWGDFRIGSAIFRAVKPCSRCQITTIDQDSGEKTGKEPLATLAKFRRQDGKVMFGENLIVVQSGRISVGDTIEMLAPRRIYPIPQRLLATAAMTGKSVRVSHVDRVFRGHFSIDKYTLQIERFDGTVMDSMTRELFRVGRAVGILLYDPHQHKIVLVEQFRIAAFANGRPAWLMECVAGMVDGDESDETVAHRETLEEAGCTITRLEPICEFLPSAGTSDEILALFIGKVDARAAGGVFGLADEHEDIRVHVLPVAEALALLDGGTLLNVTVQLALLWFARHGAAVRQRWLAG